MNPLPRLLLPILALLWSPCLAAHPAPYSQLELELEDHRISGALQVHASDIARELDIDEPQSLFDHGVLAGQYAAIRQKLQQRIKLADGEGRELAWRFTGIARAPGDGDALRLSLRADGPPPPVLQVDVALFPADPAHHTFVNIREGGVLVQQFLFDRDSAPQRHFAGTSAGIMALAGTFLPAGVEHVLAGADHVLFVLGLILLGGSWRRLALIVTAFTLGHSVTLALAALGILVLPAWLIEPLIALSIVVVGADNLLRGPGRDLRPAFAALFGLVHGFGFAFVLREFGLPQAQLAWALVSFNLGVELGQLLIVIPAALLLAALRQRAARLARRVAVAGSLAVIAAGLYWFVDRVRMMGS